MKILLDKRKPIPLYRQLKESLKEKILSQELFPNQVIPSLQELTSTLEVSKITVRQAIRELTQEELLITVPGKGTFVAEPKVNVSRLFSIAMLIPETTNFFAPLIQGVEDFAQEKGYHLIICNTEYNVKKTAKYVSEFEERNNIDGIISAPPREGGQVLMDYIKHLRKHPFVLIEVAMEQVEGLEVDCVCMDSYAGAYQAVSHLIKLGHKRIAYMGTNLRDYFTDNERLNGYRDALVDSGLPFDASLVLNIGGTKYFQMIKNFLLEQKPTAMFSFNDNQAREVFDVAKAVGLKVPHDLSLVGYDDTEVAKYLEVPLTTVSPPKYEMGKKAAWILIDKVEGKAKDCQQILLEPTLVFRQSTAERGGELGKKQ